MWAHHVGGLWVLLQVGDLCSRQAATPLHPDGRVFISGAVGTLHRGTGHGAGHGGGAKQAPRPPASHRLEREENGQAQPERAGDAGRVKDINMKTF